MAYDQNKEWQIDEPGELVEKRLPGLLDTTSPLMEKARGDAVRTANRRGLQNSSIAAGEGTKAVLSVATDIAKADAGTIGQKNLAAQGFGYNTKLTSQNLAGQKDIAGLEIQGRKDVQGQADAAALSRLREQFGSDAERDAAKFAFEKEQTGAQLTSNEKIAAGNWANALKTTGMSIASNENIADRNIGANTTNTNNTAFSTGVTNANTTYANSIASINSNPDLPPDVRDKLIIDARVLKDATIAMLQAVFDAPITWNAPRTGGPAQGPGTPTASTPTAPGAD